MKKMSKTFQFFPVAEFVKRDPLVAFGFLLLENFMGFAKCFFADPRLRAQGKPQAVAYLNGSGSEFSVQVFSRRAP